MTSVGKDSLKTQRTLAVGNRNYEYFSLPVAEQKLGDISRLPISLKILLENILRLEDGRAYTVEHAQAIAGWPKKRTSTQEVAFRPARILMQDFTGVPAIVDLAAMRDGIVRLGGKPETINPLVPVDLVIDHSVTVDFYARNDALFKNVDVEFVRNDERYAFLRWGQHAFDNFRVGVSTPLTMSASCPPARESVIKSISSISRKLSGPRTPAAGALPTPTRCLAPTVTQR